MRVTLVNARATEDSHGDRFISYEEMKKTLPVPASTTLDTLAHGLDDIQLIPAHTLNMNTEEVIDRIQHFGPDVVGISTTNVSLDGSLEIIKSTKQMLPKPYTVLGGIFPSQSQRESWCPAWSATCDSDSTEKPSHES